MENKDQKIAVVVPTNRPEKVDTFLAYWCDLFCKHNVTLYIVRDGANPSVQKFEFSISGYKDPQESTLAHIMTDEYIDLIYSFNDGVRNLGFAAAYKDGADIIISLDDDTTPEGDTIQDHLDALSKKYPISWLNTVDEIYMRGVPYSVREEAECVLSHGTWKGVADFDASTQLVLGTPTVTPRRMPVPKGVLFPMCIMNVAFKRKMTPFMYQAPMFGDVNRFADIWGGIEAKKDIDKQNLCAVTGYATVNHARASDPFVNLIKEAPGVKMNEEYNNATNPVKGEYFENFMNKRKRWQEFLLPLITIE